MSTASAYETNSLAKITANLMQAVHHGEEPALSRLEQIQEEGMRFNIAFILDSSGSMKDDQRLVFAACSRLLANIGQYIPDELTQAIEEIALNLSGSVLRVRDLLCDSTPFELYPYRDLSPEDLDQLLSEIFNAEKIYGGGTNLGESQLLGLLFSLGLPSNHKLIFGIFNQMTGKNYPDLLDESSESFKTQYRTHFADPSRSVPNLCILVTDEPPREEQQDLISTAQLEELREEMGSQWPGIVILTRNSGDFDNFTRWSQVGKRLGASVYKLDDYNGTSTEERIAGLSEILAKNTEPLLSRQFEQELHLLPATTGNN